MSRNELKDVEAALTHDLNNTLQVVMGNLEVLRRRAAFVPEIVDAALSATRGAAHLADRLAAVTRLRHVEPRRLDLNAALTDLTDMMQRTLGDAIRLDLDLSPSAGAVLVDPRCLQTALLELAANARNAMPTGGRVLVRSAPARVDITDTGPGMAAEKIAAALQAINPGALGLHIVARCMGSSGGRVEIAAAAPRGTTVTLYLSTE
jgi:signal transduction histidine kinase